MNFKQITIIKQNFLYLFPRRLHYVSIFFALILLIIFIHSPKANAAQATLTWDDSNQAGLVAGYHVYCGTSSGNYQTVKDVQGQTSCIFDNLTEGQIYYFAVQAYSSTGIESNMSAELAYAVPVTQTSTSGSGTTSTTGTTSTSGTTSTTGTTSTSGTTGTTSQSSSTFDAIHEVIIDNGAIGTSSIGKWKNSSGKSYYGTRSYYNQTPGDSYSYETAVNGPCKISMWWTEYSTRSTSVPVEIYDGDQLLATVHVDQMQNGGQWNVLGTYTFTGTARVVIQSTSSDYSTCADAVKFSCSEVIIDNGGDGTSSTGTWKNSSGVNYYGSQSVFSETTGDTYTYTDAINGNCEISMWWTEYTTRSTSVPVEIYDGDKLLDTIYVDQTQNGGQWNVLGTYTFTGTARVVIQSTSNNYSTCADAIKFTGNSTVTNDGTPMTVVVDNGGNGTSSTGTWKNSSGTNYYGSQSVFSQTAGDTYTYTAAINGSCEISMWWTEYTTRSTSVPVEIYDGNQLLDTVYVDQTQNGGQWNILDTYTFTGTARVVIQSTSNNYSTCADAVKFVVQ